MGPPGNLIAQSPEVHLLVPRLRIPMVANGIIPRRELLVCLVVVAGKKLGASTKVLGTSTQGHWGLQTGLHQWHSDEASRADSARRGTEDREGRHLGAVVYAGVNWGRWRSGRGDERSEVKL